MSLHSSRPSRGRIAADCLFRISRARALAPILLLGAAAPALAQVSLTTLDVPYAQTFDGLPATGSATWSNNATIPGWYRERTGSGTTIVASNGSSNAGALYSFGTGTTAERALGSIGSGSAGHFFWGVRLQNNTGSTITSLDVAYTGEQWRNGGGAATNTAAFSYLVGAPAVDGSLAEFQLAGTPIAVLDFTSPIAGAPAAALDGNAAANRTPLAFTIEGLSIPAGTEVMLRWSDPDHGGSDHGLSIDDFTVTPHGGAPLPGLSVSDPTVIEGNAGTTTLSFQVNLSAPAPVGGVSFDIATADDSADAPTDYLANSVPGVVIPAGQDSYTFNVTVNGDIQPETDETLFANVTGVVGANAVDAQGIGTITNDDAAPTLTIADVSANEGQGGPTTFSFLVSLSDPAPAGGVTFDIATADLTATAPSDYVARALTGQLIPAGATSYAFDVTVNGDGTSEPDETFRVDVTNIVGDVILGDSQATGTIVNDDLDRIHDVQGNGASSPIVGANVAVEGVVTASFQGNGGLSGFFLQEEDTDADADPNTSEGIFVFCSSCPVPVAEGQRVRASGTVSEFFNMTQVNATTLAAVSVVDAGNHLADITPVTIDLPVVGPIDGYYEMREGMLVTYADTLAASEYFELARYGQVELYEGGRPRQFTADEVPTPAGYAAHLDELARRRVILDDRNNMQNWPLSLPDGSQLIFHPQANGGLSIGTQGTDFFRGGDQVVGLTGVLHWSFAGLSGTDAWRIRPTEANPVAFVVANPRPASAPAVGGAIKAASMNLLNYFTTIDTTSSSNSGPCGPNGSQDCRGADSPAELARQRERTSIVLCGLDADVVGLMELENTTARDTIDDLLGAVNARCGGAHPYAFVDTGGTLGTDAIRVALVYRSGVLAPAGAALVDLDPVHNRPPTAQVFDVADAANAAFGQRFSVVANHFKSKGCGDATGGDVDANDGQSCYSARRTAQAQRLRSWVASTVVPAAGGDTDVLLLGDFNSYAMEAPITTLTGDGYVDLLTAFGGAEAYSYLFDGQLGHLDYALASASFANQVTGVEAWHINADEIPQFDYSDEIRDTGEASQEEKPDGSTLVPPRNMYEAGTPWRAADHDPVLVGLFGGESDLAVTLVDAPDPAVAGDTLAYTITITNAGPNAAVAAEWNDTLPAGTGFVSLAGAAGWSCTTPAIGAGGTIACSNASFVPGSAVFTLEVGLDPALAAGSVLSNTATTSSANADPQPGDNSATATTTIAALADLSLDMVDAPDPVVAGSNLTYSITATNLGPSAAASAGWSDTLPAGTGFVSLASAAGWSCTTPALGASGTVTCTNASFVPEAAVFTLVVQVDADVAGGTVLSNSATIASATPDPAAGNETATAATTVVAAPQGNLTIDPVAVDFGTHVVGTSSAPVTVMLGNDGDAALEVASLTAATVPFSRSGGSCAAAAPFTLAAGASCTLEYVFSPTTLGAANQVLTVMADAPGSGTISLAGVGESVEADIAITIDDGRAYVQVGETLDYVIMVTHAAGTGAASVDVSDILPAELDEGAWTCVPTGGAACSGGSGNVLSDTAILPPGGIATYVYSATVLAEGSGVIANGATAIAGGGKPDPNPANNTAVDTPADIVVIFRDGFDETAETAMPVSEAESRRDPL